MVDQRGFVDNLKSRIPHRGQRGELLIESLLTLFLMATLLAAIVSLTFALLVGAWIQKKKTEGGNIATTIVEEIDRLEYVPCGPSASFASYEAAAADVMDHQESAWDRPAVVEVDFLQSNQVASTSASFGSCPSGGAGDQGIQRIRVTVTARQKASTSATVVLYKRNDRCPLGAPTVQGEPC